MSSGGTRTGSKRKSSSMAASDAGDDSASNASSTNTANVPSQHHKLRHHHHGQQSSGSVGNQQQSNWDCSVCTYSNPAESFKCMICDTRKGTSTRKPRLNPQVVEMQEMIQSAILRGGGSAGAGAPGGAGDHGGDAESDQSGSQSLPRLSSGGAKHPTSGGGGGAFRKGSGAVSLGGARNHHHHQKLPRLRNVDRSTARHIPVTANGVTVIITDFKPKTSVASAVAKSKRSVAMESSSNAAATGDHADDSSTSIASPPMPNSLLTSTNLPPPSLTNEDVHSASGAPAPAVSSGMLDEETDSIDRRSESPPQISPQKFD
ncbi:hypothetical protein BOX15_Mlig014229g1 [Macrostomum lignano]|uniref:RanBP2-type domain-containing protein n=1 Tax=Macrostomum lignano TaxID=282301 RepID=A0A267F4H0_9PLAT|nr:hypothetical protein BOX15_Mlig014229g1 [Macrostomum lignano]